MIVFFTNIFNNIGLSKNLSSVAGNIIVLLIMYASIYILDFIIKSILKVAVEKYIKKIKYKWDNVLIDRKITNRVSNLIIAIITILSLPIFKFGYENVINKIIWLYIIGISTHIIAIFLSCANDIYNTFEISKSKPIKGIIQIIQIVVYTCGVIILISKILEQSPVIILSGLGALSAVAMIVFKDSLLGFVAGIQISANNMVKIGDWITLSSEGAEGTVKEISLNTITIENFDKTITNIPTYSLISNSFKNWKGIQQIGARRMKRCIFIDVNSVKFCDEKMLKRFKKVNYLKEYIEEKEKEIKEYNKIHIVNNDEIINTRRLTNIGTFRIYIYNYLKFHPKINPDIKLIVRQLEANEYGIPLEVYAFINDTKWENYEGVQSDIFDHLYSIAKEFDIKLSQKPLGNDLERINIK